MATSTCVKCGNSTFEMIEVTPRYSQFILNFVQCETCGGVVGVMDWMLHDMAKKLHIGSIE